jgi:acyl-[acyl-carrier-protein]-phospholipid O-acyltransferase/long-chain-fatty-acid--[acyl-carrier-protein] ligase
MKPFFLFLLRLLFGFRAWNPGVLQTPGPVLLLPNHCSWIDWLFLFVLVDDDWRFVTSKEAAQASWVHRCIMLNRFTFPIEMTSPYAVKRMAEYLQNGGKLVLFPEGRLSRTGSLMKLFDGTGFLIFKTQARVITCYLRGTHRILFSPNPNHKQWFPRVSAHFSAVLTPPRFDGMRAFGARAKLTRWLYDAMTRQRFDIETALGPGNVLATLIETARHFPSSRVLEDVSRKRLTFRRVLAGSSALAAQWRQLFPNPNPNPDPSASSDRIGILLPNSNAVPLTLLSLWSAQKVPAIFNFSTGVPTMLACAQLANVKHILTSRLFLERVKLNLQPMSDAGIEFIYLEDLRARISRPAQWRALARAIFNPRSIASLPAPASMAAGAPAVILFTSGSEGPPKGVELTHGNLLANIRQILSVIDLMDSDRVFNALPLFHSFGLLGLLLPLVRGSYVFLYPSPLHYRVIPSLLYDLDCTIFFGTNTFLGGYARKAHAYDFRTVRMLLASGEKLQETTANTWARQFGVRALEGYGATECSPAITLNTLVHPRFGSAGRILPAIEYKLEPVEGVAEGGRLWVRGPNVMRGYLNPEPNAKFQAQAGWYDTGDIANVDSDGFLYILGRLKRFAKISGEMVSLTAAEEALARAFPQYGLRFQVAVLARPDADRGEALIAVSNEPKLNLEEIRAAIKAAGLSNLCVPREVKYIRDIPKLGAGKTNHRELQALILDSK